MKKLLSLVILFVSINGNGQLTLYGVKLLTRKGVDSLHQLLPRQKTAKEQVDVLNSLARGSFNTGSIDSAFYYGQKALQKAEKIKYPRGEMEARSWLVRYHFQTGNFPSALQLALHNLERADQTKDTGAIYATLNGVARTYSESRDYLPSIQYLHRMKHLLRSGYYKNDQEIKNLSHPVYILLGIAYDGLQNEDSAYYYKKLAYQVAVSTKDHQRLALSAGNLAKYYADRNNSDSAFSYFRVQAIHALKTGGFRTDLVAEAELGMGELFFKNGHIDSALYYGRSAYQKCRQLKQTDLEWRTASFLNNVFDKQGKVDSAYRYLTLSVALKDSLFNQQKIKQQERIKYEEVIRIGKLQQEAKEAALRYKANVRVFVLVAVLLMAILIGLFLYRSGRNKQKVNTVLQAKNQEIEKAYSDLKATQAQLVQKEKMASLGELTAGIAHEIQNPLNFVNNFSEANAELIEEAQAELGAGNTTEVSSILGDIKANEQKIAYHGKRADSIVKGMLQHSQAARGQKEPTDINALVDEYLRLSYHGFRARDKQFTAALETTFDPNIGKVNIVPQDLGRVLLNLFNNGFYAVSEKKKGLNGTYEPALTVFTRKVNGQMEIGVKDNGTGIPKKAVEKIFQPFFTTKPTGQGTGLGLSLSYDIVKAHGGELKVATKEGEGSEFILSLPLHQ